MDLSCSSGSWFPIFSPVIPELLVCTLDLHCLCHAKVSAPLLTRQPAPSAAYMAANESTTLK